MAEQFLKNFSVLIHKQLFAEESELGRIAVYETAPFGTTLTINDQIVLAENDGFILHEMLVHPALFTHANPKRVAIIGNHCGILEEVVKHTNIQKIACVAPHTFLEEIICQYFKNSTPSVHDERIEVFEDMTSFAASCQKEPVDIIIYTEKAGGLDQVAGYLSEDGILVHPALPSLLHLSTLKQLFIEMQACGFNECQTLNFPQPSAAHGWRTIILATKRSGFKSVKEVNIFNRSFNTRFYNYDMHKAALVLPEFMREELGM